MRKSIFVSIIVSLALYNCQPKEVKQEQPILKPTTLHVVEKPFSNFALVEGSSYGVFIQSLWLNNQFETLLKFTSTRTKTKFGNKNLLNFYKIKFDFAYKLGHLSNTYQLGDTTVLCYTKANKFATRRKINIPCIIENDTVKLILYNLKTPFE